MSSSGSFVHLHNHTTYSLLDGAQKIDEMCARAAGDGQTAIAITDHGNLFGAPSFARTAARHGIRPILGLEAYVAPGSRFDRQAQVVEGIGRKNYYHLVLLAENYTGYKNLIKLSTAGYLEGFYYRPRIDHELLARHSEGLICLSACLAGEVATQLQQSRHCGAPGRCATCSAPSATGSSCRTTGSKPSNRSMPRRYASPRTWVWAPWPRTTAITSCPPTTRRTTS
jgi:DNA polymerase III alpha subunit